MDLAGKTERQLQRLLSAAETRYALAKEARQNKGDRIESAKETIARQRRDSIRVELRNRWTVEKR